VPDTVLRAGGWKLDGIFLAASAALILLTLALIAGCAALERKK